MQSTTEEWQSKALNKTFVSPTNENDPFIGEIHKAFLPSNILYQGSHRFNKGWLATHNSHIIFSMFSPTFRLNSSPQNNRSNLLYDSYELQAVVKQLNRAIQGTKGGGNLSPSTFYLRSPHYRQRINNIYKENAKVPKKISSSQKGNTDGAENKASTRPRANKVLQQLWEKVKHRFSRSRR